MKWKELETKYQKEETKVKGWKQFLKPDKRKIFLAVLLIILSILLNFPPFSIFYILFIMILNALLGGAEYYLSLPATIVTFIIDPFGEVIRRLQGTYWTYDYWLFQEFFLYFPLFVALSFGWYYILSCLIVWVYDKYKKKNK